MFVQMPCKIKYLLEKGQKNKIVFILLIKQNPTQIMLSSNCCRQSYSVFCLNVPVR